MNRRRIVRIAACAIATFTFVPFALAALPPGAEKKMKDSAQEKLQLQVTGVKKVGEAPNGCEKLVYTAKVTKVVASKSGIKPGQTVTIHAYHWTVEYQGPSNPPRLTKGWSGRAYLNPNPKAKGTMKLAAYGASLVSD